MNDSQLNFLRINSLFSYKFLPFPPNTRSGIQYFKSKLKVLAGVVVHTAGFRQADRRIEKSTSPFIISV